MSDNDMNRRTFLTGVALAIGNAGVAAGATARADHIRSSSGDTTTALATDALGVGAGAAAAAITAKLVQQ